MKKLKEKRYRVSKPLVWPSYSTVYESISGDRVRKKHKPVSSKEYNETGLWIDLATDRFMNDNPTYKFTHGRARCRDMILTVALLNIFKKVYPEENEI